MTANRPIRLGIIGCGNVLSAYRSAIDRLRLRGLAEVTMACGRESQRKSACAGLCLQRFTTNADELIGSADVDLVLILTSMAEHASLVRAALQAGKHVLVEKPLATSLEEARALVRMAKRSRGYLLCAPFTILSPTFQTMARRIRRGEIGRVCSARARYGWSGPSWSEWFYRPGGGCLFDLGVYCVTSLTGLLGPAKRVLAMTGVAIPEREINGKMTRVRAEDNAQVLLDFGNSAFAVVTTGFTLQQYRSPALEIYGTTGTIQMLGDDWHPEGYELWQNSVGAWQVFKESDPDWPWTDGLRHLVECIRKGRRPLVTPEHACHVLEIMVKAQQSGREGRALTIDSAFPLPVFRKSVGRARAHLVHDRARVHPLQ
ncbi:MAG: Gfo/Idh/MocA family oxidoreductase [Verrucomicrobia bacterium]|nr:Gfo/Idh/MocA family oxidoreductase [Verrucomicrobiota bacterium]